MKQQVLLSLILAGSLVAVSAHAQEETSNTSTVKVSDVQKKDETKKDIDDEITNAKMRAESGSKSKWSLSADLGLNGGNLEDPLGRIRPNYSGEVSTNDVTYLDGTVAGSYRVNANQRVNFGTGISILTPFQSTSEEILKSSEDGGATEVSTPYLSWKYSGRIGSTQNAVSLTYSHATSNYDLNSTKITGGASLSHVILFDIAGSNWQPGFSTAVGTQIFSEGNPNTYDYYVALYPFVEYAFNDTYSFRTVFRPFTFNHMAGESDAMTFKRSMYTQSVGLGIAVARDLYLYPNMQFAPENLSPELTNVGLNMTANVF